MTWTFNRPKRPTEGGADLCLERLKREARKMSKQPNAGTHMQCLEVLAQKAGFKTYAALRASLPPEQRK